MASTSLRKFSACLVRSDCSSSARQLGDAVDQPRDFLAEALLDLGQRDAGVLDRVVQQGGRDRRESSR
jgi:hypothetical protein